MNKNFISTLREYINIVDIFEVVGRDCKDDENEYNCTNNYCGVDDTKEKD